MIEQILTLYFFKIDLKQSDSQTHSLYFKPFSKEI
jgi:hypothetical protein